MIKLKILIFSERTLSLRNMSCFKISKSKTEQISMESSNHLQEILLNDFNRDVSKEKSDELFEIGQKFSKSIV